MLCQLDHVFLGQERVLRQDCAEAFEIKDTTTQRTSRSERALNAKIVGFDTTKKLAEPMMDGALLCFLQGIDASRQTVDDLVAPIIDYNGQGLGNWNRRSFPKPSAINGHNQDHASLIVN
jgi:hypothetical protein